MGKITGGNEGAESQSGNEGNNFVMNRVRRLTIEQRTKTNLLQEDQWKESVTVSASGEEAVFWKTSYRPSCRSQEVSRITIS